MPTNIFTDIDPTVFAGFITVVAQMVKSKHGREDLRMVHKQTADEIKIDLLRYFRQNDDLSKFRPVLLPIAHALQSFALSFWVTGLKISAESANGSGTFTRFGELPKELQKMIWKFALPGPRIIEDPFALGGHCLYNSSVLKAQSIDLLNLMKTCKDANDIVKKMYHSIEVEIRDCWGGLALNPLRGDAMKLLLCPEKDTFYLADDRASSLLSHLSLCRLSTCFDNLANVQTIAIDLDTFRSWAESKDDEGLWLSRFKALKKIVLVNTDGRRSRRPKANKSSYDTPWKSLYFENANPNVAKEFQKYWHGKLQHAKLQHNSDVEHMKGVEFVAVHRRYNGATSHSVPFTFPSTVLEDFSEPHI
jgi:hypothetical protein